MEETSIVRQNLMDDVNYRPYCGNNNSLSSFNYCMNPRTEYDSVITQFRCPDCGWTSEFPEDFIQRYKTKHGL